MFKKISNNKVYNQIITQIKENIKTGQLQKGDRLPSERNMSEQMGVSRATIREALRSLEIMGIIKCVQGEGNFICDNLDNSLIEPLSMMFMLNQGKLNEINELRRALELEAVKLASERISEESVKIIEDLCETIVSSKDESKRAQADKKFHYEIAKASGNVFIMNILSASSSLMENFIKDVRTMMLMEEKNIDIINEHHRGIVEGLKNRDSKLALKYMKAHMDMINSFVSE
ncbi:MAG: FadR family transcriptional regulator [Firmicutes bacterium]|jgi:GntR family transcriptional repressor for pyruvate dehydrogenase complex|nr:FadR family transcriptional regulator [Bacillota bacterium]